MSKIIVIFLGIISIFMSFESLALQNENYKVTQVDVTKSLGIVWMNTKDRPFVGQPECNAVRYDAVTCEIDDSYCKSVISIALIAKSTGGEVDFQFDGLCKGSFSTGDRFRLSY